MSSPSRILHPPALTEPPQLNAAPTLLQGSSVGVMNSIYSAVIKVFQGEGLQINELYSLTEGIRWLLKTKMGSFISAYFQDQLLNKGFSYMIGELQQYEGRSQLAALSEVWNNFFAETLPTLQAIFHPLQGQELTVRQMTLLGFRDLVLMKLPLEELLQLDQSLLSSSIPQMLLILQGVHEPRGPSTQYYQLEKMLEMVVSPYLWNSKHIQDWKAQPIMRGHHGNPEIRLTQYTSERSLLAPLVEQDGEVYLERMGSLRRNTVANAHSDAQLLSATNQMSSGMGDSCEVVGGIGLHVASHIPKASHSF